VNLEIILHTENSDRGGRPADFCADLPRRQRDPASEDQVGGNVQQTKLVSQPPAVYPWRPSRRA